MPRLGFVRDAVVRCAVPKMRLAVSTACPQCRRSPGTNADTGNVRSTSPLARLISRASSATATQSRPAFTDM